LPRADCQTRNGLRSAAENLQQLKMNDLQKLRANIIELPLAEKKSKMQRLPNPILLGKGDESRRRVQKITNGRYQKV
jgi:hypothetical protein